MHLRRRVREKVTWTFGRQLYYSVFDGHWREKNSMSLEDCTSSFFLFFFWCGGGRVKMDPFPAILFLLFKKSNSSADFLSLFCSLSLYMYIYIYSLLFE